MAYEVPDDQIVRFFVYWNDQQKRVGVDLHFVGIKADGTRVNICWSSHNKTGGMVRPVGTTYRTLTSPARTR